MGGQQNSKLSFLSLCFSLIFKITLIRFSCIDVEFDLCVLSLRTRVLGGLGLSCYDIFQKKRNAKVQSKEVKSLSFGYF